MSVLESKKVLAKYINQTTERSFFNTLKIFIILFSITFLWGCSNEIDNIKNSTPEGISSLTIGELLDNHKEFVEPKWTSFKTAQGEDVVEFTAKIKDPLLPELDKFYVRTPFKVQFLLNKKDDGYKIGYVGYEFELKDPELVEKIKFQKSEPVSGYNGLVYYEDRRIETPINLEGLFEARFSDEEIFNLIYSGTSIIANELFANDELRRTLQHSIWVMYYYRDFESYTRLYEIFKDDFLSLEKVTHPKIPSSLHSAEVVEESDRITEYMVFFYISSLKNSKATQTNQDDIFNIIEKFATEGNFPIHFAGYAKLSSFVSEDLNERRKITKKILDVGWDDSYEKQLVEEMKYKIPDRHLNRLKTILPKIKVVKGF